MATVDELLRQGVERLRQSGSETPRLDAEVLLAHALGSDRTAVLAHPEAVVGATAAQAYDDAVRRRESGEPVAYIRGFKEFRGLALATDPRALIPRPETETLVDRAEIEVARRLTAEPRPPGTPPLRIADVGTGCGTIAVALAVALRRRRMLDDVVILAIDASTDALQLARENAVSHAVADRVRFLEADLLPAVADPPFEVVLANLPYIPTGMIPELPVAASFEPRVALDGGPDGLTELRRLIDRLPEALAPGGVALLEIGADQGEAVIAVAGERLPGWVVSIEPDLSGAPRVAVMVRPADRR